MPPSANFRVDLDIYRGPMDLLLYLVRKHELEISDLPVSLITDQYLEHLEVLKEIDINAVGDFLEMASTLAEIKSRMALPRADEEEEEVDEARQELVRRLLEYKKFRDAATVLEERSRAWQERFTRQATDVPPRERNLADEPIHELEIWDLVSALARTIREHDAVKPANIVYDDTPIHVYMQRIHDRLMSQEKVAFSQMFQSQMHKSALVGMFLAMMELIRHHGVQAQQEQLFGEIWLIPSEQTRGPVDFTNVDDYQHPPAEEEPDSGEESDEAS